MKRLLLSALMLASLSACAPYATRYRENLATVRVPKWVQLAQADREAIAALIARTEKIEMLVGITKRHDDWLAVTVGSESGSIYDLTRENGRWQIKRRGSPVSMVVLQLVLTDTPEELAKRRKWQREGERAQAKRQR